MGRSSPNSSTAFGGWLTFIAVWMSTVVVLQASVIWTGYWKGYEPIIPWKESWSAQKKFELISDKIDTAVRSSPPFYNYAELLRNLGTFPFIPGVDLQKVLDRSTWRPRISDRKTLHTQGTYGRVQIEWTPEAKQFTGVFQDEVSPYAVLNYSNGFRLPQVSNFFGISLNIFRDGAPPASLLTAFNFFSVPNWNIFNYMHCNHYNWVYGLPLLPFSTGQSGNAWTSFFSMMGVSDMGTFDGQGNVYNKVKTPWALCFRPTEKLRAEFDGFPPFKHPSELLQFVEPGEHLYELIAITEADALMYPEKEYFMKYVVKVADITLEKKFERCEWCDSVLWVRHTIMEEDLAHRPDWTPIATNLKYLIRTGSVGLYQHIFPPTSEDQINYQVALTKYSDRMLRFFSSKSNFVELLRQFGVTPTQLFEEQLLHSLQALKISAEALVNSKLDEDGYPYVGPMIKISPRWVHRMVKNFGGPIVQYWKNLGLGIMEKFSDVGPTPVSIESALDFANSVVLRMNDYYNEPNMAVRLRNLKYFIRTASPLLTAFHTNLCQAFARSSFFIDCDAATEWLMENACELHVLAEVKEAFSPAEIIDWRKDFCKLDPPAYILGDTSQPITIDNTLFSTTPILEWPEISNEYLERIKEEFSPLTFL